MTCACGEDTCCGLDCDDDRDEYDRDDDPDSGPCIGAECTLPDPWHTAAECVTVEMMQAWEAFEREQERRRRWPRVYAALDAVRALWWRLRTRAPKPIGEGDDSIPF